jgi:hypothetical protein
MQFFLWVVAQLAEHLTVNEVAAGSNPVDPPTLIEAVAERRMHFIVDEDDDGSSPFGLAKSGRLAETDQRRREEPKSLVRYQERPSTARGE